uniref:Uncharacterized protein n=1 Tax=Globodera rostochiensis TaxID=31243 RepID=A0A914I7J2_GLORO
MGPRENAALLTRHFRSTADLEAITPLAMGTDDAQLIANINWQCGTWTAAGGRGGGRRTSQDGARRMEMGMVRNKVCYGQGQELAFRIAGAGIGHNFCQ